VISFEIRLPPLSTGAPSATGLMFDRLLLQAGADGLLRPYLPGVDLGESLLDFADETSEMRCEPKLACYAQFQRLGVVAAHRDQTALPGKRAKSSPV
jgi:hypothetical protein